MAAQISPAAGVCTGVWGRLGFVDHLEETGGKVVLQISDNGCGIGAADIRKGGTFGLLGMRERLAALGGECDICGEPGRGTIVHVSVPVSPGTEGKNI